MARGSIAILIWLIALIKMCIVKPHLDRTHLCNYWREHELISPGWTGASYEARILNPCPCLSKASLFDCVQLGSLVWAQKLTITSANQLLQDKKHGGGCELPFWGENDCWGRTSGVNLVEAYGLLYVLLFRCVWCYCGYWIYLANANMWDGK